MDQTALTYYAWLVVFITLTALSVFLKGKGKTFAVTGLIVLSGIFVAQNMYKGFVARAGKGHSASAGSRAELPLKLSSGYVAMESYGQSLPGAHEATEQIKKISYDQAEELLGQAIKARPKSESLLMKKIILDGEQGKSTKKLLKKMKALDTPKAKNLANLLEKIYTTKRIRSSEYAALKKIVEKDVPHGWFKEIANLQLAKSAKKSKEFKKLHEDFHEHYMYYMLRFGGFICVMAFCFLVGIIVIFSQLFLMGRRMTKEEDRKLIIGPESFSFVAVLGIFLGWLTIGFLMGPAVRNATDAIPKEVFKSNNSLVALYTATVYLITNVPGLILVWLIAIKPHGLKFFETLKVKFNVAQRGPFKLFFTGVFAWFAAIPFYALTIALSVKFGLQGSDNPIIQYVTAAAQQADIAGVIFFFIVIGVLPGFCEELFFRGFLYTAMRRRLNAFFSMVISALIFSLIHLDFGGAIGLFFLGFIFAYVTEKTKSIVPSMIAHCMWNSSGFIMSLVAYS